MILAIDIGNTTVALGGIRDGRVCFVARMDTVRTRTAAEYRAEMDKIFAHRRHPERPMRFEGAVLTSVVPQITGALAECARHYTGRKPVIVSPEIRTICAGYFFSALFLTLCNRVLHRRASGHACSAAGPLLFLIYYFGWWMLLPSIVIGWLVAWASVALKRHTPTDLLWGALCSAAGFAIAVLWF